MKYYEVIKSRQGMLTFLTAQDSFDCALMIGETLKSNHNTVWLRSSRFDYIWRESITTVNIIESLLDRKIIREIKDK